MKTWITHGMLSILALFAPAQELFLATGILIVADLVTGVWAAKKTGKQITSAGLRRTVSKMIIYNLAIGCAFLVQRYMMADHIPVSNIVSSAIGLTELKSILENADRISGGSLMKTIIARLGSANDNKTKGEQ